ncbi:hypothetical protein BYT27DRAFT_6495269 [Phlegmacium glaucopus]|nr:hypothetical protein BYT27DRAFT_6495269 [Phlegmacium glaucopus]
MRRSKIKRSYLPITNVLLSCLVVINVYIKWSSGPARFKYLLFSLPAPSSRSSGLRLLHQLKRFGSTMLNGTYCASKGYDTNDKG